MDERAYADVGEESWHHLRNRGEISSGELRHSGMRDPIGVDVSETLHLGHGRCVCRSVEDDLEKNALSFVWKDTNPLTNRRISKYDADQESRTGAP